MKIAYVVLHMEKEIVKGGVGKKILSQIKEWRKHNNAEVFVLSKDKFAHSNFHIFSYAKPLHSKAFYGKLFSWINMLFHLIRDVKKYDPDIIYLRYGSYLFPLHKLFDIGPTIVEVNTLDIGEYKLRGIFLYVYNLIFRNVIFSKCKGIVCVTSEISNHKSITKFSKKVLTLGNGIEPSDRLYEKNKKQTVNNIPPRVIFIGSFGYPWQGIEKLNNLAKILPSIHFDLVGVGREDLIDILPEGIAENLTPHGFLNETEYAKLFLSADVGISSLSLHTIPLMEGSTLKTREYLVNGLPTIIPHEDVDFKNHNFSFILNIPNTADNIFTHHKEIEKFIYKMKGYQVPFKLVEKNISSEFKEVKRMKFFEEIIQDNISFKDYNFK